MTIISDAHAVSGLIGEMILMDSRMAMIRKYTLAKRLNCNSKASLYKGRYWAEK